MFVIYTPETRQFLQCIIPTSTTPWLEWDCEIHDIGILPTKEDAIMMAEEVQQIHAAAERIFHYSVLVLRIGPDKQPEYGSPVYELIASRRIS